jgi:uncharacterized protein YcgI (DUF1989 family)
LKNKQNLKNKNKNLISSKKVIAYAPPRFSIADWKKYAHARKDLILKKEILVQPRHANHFKVKAGQFFRINVTSGSKRKIFFW